MKRGFMYFMFLFAILVGGVTTAGAQSKAVQKMVKKTVKEKRKQGWELHAGTTTLEYALLKYHTYMEEDEENRISIIGIAMGRNPKIGRENAIAHGISSYSSRAKSRVVGKLKELLSSTNTNNKIEEIDKFGAAYEIGVNSKIGTLVRQHYVLKRTGKDGLTEFQVYMSLDESQAKKARLEAAEEAKRKAALPELSQDVIDFIGTPVPAED